MELAEVRDAIINVVQAVTSHHQHRAGHDLRAKVDLISEPLATPLGEALAVVWAAARGERVAEHLHDACREVLDALFQPPLQFNGYEIPEEFWATPTGRAVRAALSGGSPLRDEDLVTTSQAAAMAGVTKGAVSQWAAIGWLDQSRRACRVRLGGPARASMPVTCVPSRPGVRARSPITCSTREPTRRRRVSWILGVTVLTPTPSYL